MTTLEGRSVAVTGAGGFIGGHVVERLVRDGARVRAMCRYNSRNERGTLDWLEPNVVAEVEVVLGELRDLESVATAIDGSEIVLHLGAQIAIPYSYVNPRDFFEVNVLGTLNVAQAALRHDVQRVVHTSIARLTTTRNASAPRPCLWTTPLTLSAGYDTERGARNAERCPSGQMT